MADKKEGQHVRDWVKEKLDEGIDEQRIKESLEETGHDSSLVEEVQNPFEDSEVDVEKGEELFADSDETSSDEEETESKDPKEKEKKEETGPSSGESAGSDGTPDPEEEYDDPWSRRKAKEEEEDSGSRLPEFSVPSFNVLGLGVREKAPSSRKFYASVLVLVLVLGLGGGLQTGVIDAKTVPSVGSVSSPIDLGGDGSADTSGKQGCPDSGVRINSISSGNFRTTAEILVTRNPAEVVLKVFRNGNLEGQTTAELEGTTTVTVGATGDKAILHPVGCPARRSTTDIS